jgi:hypothetical protein
LDSDELLFVPDNALDATKYGTIHVRPNVKQVKKYAGFQASISADLHAPFWGQRILTSMAENLYGFSVLPSGFISLVPRRGQYAAVLGMCEDKHLHIEKSRSPEEGIYEIIAAIEGMWERDERLKKMQHAIKTARLEAGIPDEVRVLHNQNDEHGLRLIVEAFASEIRTLETKYEFAGTTVLVAVRPHKPAAAEPLPRGESVVAIAQKATADKAAMEKKREEAQRVKSDRLTQCTPATVRAKEGGAGTDAQAAQQAAQPPPPTPPVAAASPAAVAEPEVTSATASAAPTETFEATAERASAQAVYCKEHGELTKIQRKLVGGLVKAVARFPPHTQLPLLNRLLSRCSSAQTPAAREKVVAPLSRTLLLHTAFSQVMPLLTAEEHASLYAECVLHSLHLGWAETYEQKILKLQHKAPIDVSDGDASMG